MIVSSRQMVVDLFIQQLRLDAIYLVNTERSNAINRYQRALPILALVIAMALMSARSTGLDQADKIIHGGTVVTVDDSNPTPRQSGSSAGMIPEQFSQCWKNGFLIQEPKSLVGKVKQIS